ncbi:MAG: hypothetical protein ABDH66_06690 [Bacteroidia bacterium]
MRVGPKALAELEALFRRNGYTLKYLKGSFQSGPCRLYDNKMVIINAIYPPAGRVRALAAIAEQLEDKLELTPSERDLIHRLAS